MKARDAAESRPAARNSATSPLTCGDRAEFRTSRISGPLCRIFRKSFQISAARGPAARPGLRRERATHGAFPLGRPISSAIATYLERYGGIPFFADPLSIVSDISRKPRNSRMCADPPSGGRCDDGARFSAALPDRPKFRKSPLTSGYMVEFRTSRIYVRLRRIFRKSRKIAAAHGPAARSVMRRMGRDPWEFPTDLPKLSESAT